MNWFFVAVLGPLFWSLSNVIDKYLLSKHLHGVGKGALILYSTFFGLIMLPIAFVVDQEIFSVQFKNILILVAGGVLSSVGIYFYLYALEDDDMSSVVPLWQTIPVFGYILGYFVLGESLGVRQIIGCLIIVSGAALLSFDFKAGKPNFRKKVSMLMLLSSFAFATYEIMFKLAAVDEGFWKATFWQYVGLFLFGAGLFTVMKKYRQDFLRLIRVQNLRLFSINALNEGLTILGNSFYNFALLLAPVATLVLITTGYQPIFVFVWGLALTFFLPNIIKEKTAVSIIFHRATSIFFIVLGTYLIL